MCGARYGSAPAVELTETWMRAIRDHAYRASAALAAEKGCVACHGAKGKAIAPMYPNLNGQWETYLRKQLVAYRDGSRENAIMALQAQNLSDEDIAVLAAHYGN